jgi:pilus assembly protein CpaF
MQSVGKALVRENSQVLMITLMVQAPQSPSRRVQVTRSPFRIGRHEANQLCLPSFSLEDVHLEIRADREGQASLHAYAPVELNGQVVQESALNSGDRIKLAEFTIVFQNSFAASKTEAPVPQKTFVPPVEPKVKAAPVKKNPQLQRYFALQKFLHKELLENLDLKHLDIGQYSEVEMKRKSEDSLRKIIARMDPVQLAGFSIEKVVVDVIHQALGLGPLEDLLQDEDITEIMVNNFDKIYVERKGKLTLSESQFLDNQQVVEVIRRIIAPIGRRIDETNPMVDARLADGSRVNAIIAPLAISGPTITIRKFASEPFHIEDLIRFGSLTTPMATFLSVCVKHRKNICISGGTGSGKTTLLGVIARYIPDDERIVTIEDAAELKLPQDHVVSLESKPPNLEGQGAINIRKLMINALRMRPDRIVVGECRGAEALDMLQAMNTGHDGSLTTLHANTCRDAIARLETMVMMAGMNLPSKAIVEQISSAVDVIVQTNRFPDGTRKISSISVVEGMEGDKITMQEVFAYKMKGYDANGKVLGSYVADGGIPSFYRELQERGIAVDISIFN